MTTEEEGRLREVETDIAGIEERCGNRKSSIESLEVRMGDMEKWKDKFLLLIIGLLITNTASLAVALVTLMKK